MAGWEVGTNHGSLAIVGPWMGTWLKPVQSQLFPRIVLKLELSKHFHPSWNILRMCVAGSKLILGRWRSPYFGKRFERKEALLQREERREAGKILTAIFVPLSRVARPVPALLYPWLGYLSQWFFSFLLKSAHDGFLSCFPTTLANWFLFSI